MRTTAQTIIPTRPQRWAFLLNRQVYRHRGGKNNRPHTINPRLVGDWLNGGIKAANPHTVAQNHPKNVARNVSPVPSMKILSERILPDFPPTEAGNQDKVTRKPGQRLSRKYRTGLRRPQNLPGSGRSRSPHPAFGKTQNADWPHSPAQDWPEGWAGAASTAGGGAGSGARTGGGSTGAAGGGGGAMFWGGAGTLGAAS